MFAWLKKRPKVVPVPEPGELPDGLVWDASLQERCTALLEKDLRTLAVLYAALSVTRMRTGTDIVEILPGAVRWHPTCGGVLGQSLVLQSDAASGIAMLGGWRPWSARAIWHLGTRWEPRQLLQAIRLTRDAIAWCKDEAVRQQETREAACRAEELVHKRKIASQAGDIRELLGLLVQDALHDEEQV